jgi:hypothetical protein
LKKKRGRTKVERDKGEKKLLGFLAAIFKMKKIQKIIIGDLV